MMTSPNYMDRSYWPTNNEASDVEAQQVPLAPPDDYLHATLEATFHAIKLHAKQNGYGITQFNIAFDKHAPPSPRRYDFRCAKGGVKIGEASHNHETSHPSVFAQFRRPKEEEKALIRSLHASGSAPRFIIAALVERNPECLMSLREVYNEVARIRKEFLGSLSPIEALFIELEDDTWASHHTTYDGGHVNFLFFAPHEAIDLAQLCPDILFIDALNRTNRYNMPLIDFLAVMPIVKTVSIAMEFVSAESEPIDLLVVAKLRDFVFCNLRIAVTLTDTDLSLKNVLTTVYPDVPQLLFIWNVNKNVQKAVADYWKINTSNENNEENKEKRKGSLDTWNSVISQPTEEELDESYEL
ncbi:hypothetical protein PsorP6_003988 [Peronosclerospora sorghi]|uniref:Uncharacterized protein n=1 Tax=Peronosclerospora sorghi TaxID=230839 RepID=A0ACC0VL89_9STRA|nr:hypothetical protein PsorP6_003988 [Peronosclerospora sorghi]